MRSNLLKSVLLGGVAAFALTLSAGANAAPILQYQIFDGAMSIGNPSNTSATGNIFLTGSDSLFSVSGNASSAPFLNVPNFSTNTFNVSAAGAGTLTIKISATGLTGYTGGSVLNTFTLNSLNGGGFTSGTIATYFDNSNAAYGTATLLASKTFTGSGSFSDMSTVSTSPSATFSETAIYTLNYGAGGNGTVSASSQLAAAAVPEPASLALLGAGLMGIGMVRRRRN